MGFGDVSINLPDGQNFEPTAERISFFHALLAGDPIWFGEPISNRITWDRLAKTRAAATLQSMLKELLEVDPLPYITNEIFHYTLETGKRDRIDPLRKHVCSRLPIMIFAECMDNEGKHLPQIEKDVRSLLELDSWCFPHHLEEPHYLSQEETFVDLASTQIGVDLAQLLPALESKLDPDLCASVREALDKQLFRPFEGRIRSGKDLYWWITCNHNWNSVCLANLLYCALSLKTEKQERAWYLATMEKLLRYSEDGFEESGFYTEGVSYWAYGFSHYILAAELTRVASRGEVDWLCKAKVERTSHFGARLEIQEGAYPAFADCNPAAAPPSWVKSWMNNRADPTRTARETITPVDCMASLKQQSAAILGLIFFRQEDVDACYAVERSRQIRDWFEDVQFLICRPHTDSPTRLAATFKGGHNGVNHNHNDLGTFSILIGNSDLISDPGLEIYTTRTFSQRRYESDLLNSYGHPVPVVADQLQRPGPREHRAGGYGKQFFATVLEENFADNCDCLTLDLRNAYDVESLLKLTRTFKFHRAPVEKVTVTDEVAFSSPQSFETALITYGEWERTTNGTIVIRRDGKSLQARIHTADGELEFQHIVIQESATPTRLGWRFREPIREATLTFEFTPLV